MEPYQLAKVIEWAGGFSRHSRMYCTVHLLQSAGCPFGLKFKHWEVLPYSDELTRVDIRLNSRSVTSWSPSHTEEGCMAIRISEWGRKWLRDADRSPKGRRVRRDMRGVLDRHRWLLDEHDHHLNAISSLVFRREVQGRDPDVDWTDPLWARARVFAGRIID